MDEVFKGKKIGYLHVIRCKAPEERQPAMQEYTACKPFFYQELERLKPKVIVPVGQWAVKALTNSVSILSSRGHVIPSPYGKVVPTYHPAYVKERPWHVAEFMGDLERAYRTVIGCTSDRFKNYGYVYVTERQQLLDCINDLSTKKIVAFDIETNMVEIKADTSIATIAFCGEPDKAYCIPLCHAEVDLGLSKEEWKEFLEIILMDPHITKVAHNAGFELKMLKHVYDINVSNPLEDTMLMHYSVNENRGTHGLKQLVWQFMPDAGGYEKDVEDIARHVNNNYQEIPWETLAPYNCRDVDVTRRLYKMLLKKAEFQHQEKIYREISLPLMRVLTKMEMRGVGIDTESIRHELEDVIPGQIEEAMHAILQDENVRKVEKLLNNEAKAETTSKFKKEKYVNFNVRSTDHLRRLMFRVMKLKPIKKTKKGANATDKATLQFYGEINPTIKKILEHKGLLDLKSKYLEPLYAEATSYDGRVRTHYHIPGTVTGRLSSSSPNLQNISPRVMPYFVAQGENKILIMADYSQLELRLGAWLSGDQKMIDGFKSGNDFHIETFRAMYGKDPIDDPENKIDERKIAKSINFGIWYGQGARGLADVLKISTDDAQEKLDLYLRTFTKVREYQNKIHQLVMKQGYVISHSGRIRRLPEVNSRDAGILGHALRQAVNFMIQELGSTMTEKSLIKIDAWACVNYIDDLLVLTVHDSIGSEVDVELMWDYIDRVRHIMEVEVPMELGIVGIPIKADFKIGENWGVMLKEKEVRELAQCNTVHSGS